MTARLIRLNRSSRDKTRAKIIAAAGFGVMLAFVWAERGLVAQAVTWLRLHSVVCAGLAAIASAIQVARRRVLKRQEFAGSWLAAVPVRSRTARWEALIIETLPATAAVAALTVLGASAGVVLAIAGDGHGGPLLAVWATLIAGVAIGVAVGYAMPTPKPVDLPPGSRYVPHRKANRAAKFRPSFAALGAWPVRQMFAWTQPKMVARATLPILVMMPMGTTADAAMGVIAVFGVNGALVLLCMAAIRLSDLARRWMAPLPVRAGVVTRAFLLPTLGVMVGAGAVEVLLLLAFGVSHRISAAAGFGTAAIGLLATMGGVLARRARLRGLP
ncbi:MAG: hypothetical protein QOD95_2717 [Gammaproteobacteria bacterium]|nr:hypothetical protein [Gammaproteobacteria bacterium]